MQIKLVARAGLGAALLGIVGCAPIVWDRPGTTPAQLSMDNARCRLMAEGMNPEADTETISTGHFRRDLAANAAAGIVEGVVQGLAVQHTVALCMEENGYAERAPGAKAPGVNAPVSEAAARSVVTSPVVVHSALASPPTMPVAPVPLAPSLAPPPLPVIAVPVQSNPEPVRARYYPPPITVSSY